jgi:signal peptidase I
MPADKGMAREAIRSDGSTPSTFRRIWNEFGTLALAVGIALSIRACVIEPFRIPSGSMFPTLLLGDHLFVNKFVYGIKIPFTTRRLAALRAPHRGDVIVFDVGRSANSIHPSDRRPDLPSEAFVKRLIGLPGDVIELRDGALFVNGVIAQQTPTGETFQDPRGVSYAVFDEQLPDGARHRVLDDPRRPGANGRWVIEEGRYLMMGDNRDDSNDGRYWGTIRLDEMKGPAFVLYWSWNNQGSWLSLLNPLHWFDLLVHHTRWERIGSGVE